MCSSQPKMCMYIYSDNSQIPSGVPFPGELLGRARHDYVCNVFNGSAQETSKLSTLIYQIPKKQALLAKNLDILFNIIV